MSSRQNSKTQKSPSENEPSRASRIPRRHERFGWTTLLIWMSFGALIESFLGFRLLTSDDPLRRELWSLSHFHGAMLAVVNLVFAKYAEDVSKTPSMLLITGSILMPLGFFLGGLSHPEGDPGVAIVLVPIGALCVIAAVAERAAASFRK